MTCNMVFDLLKICIPLLTNEEKHFQREINKKYQTSKRFPTTIELLCILTRVNVALSCRTESFISYKFNIHNVAETTLPRETGKNRSFYCSIRKSKQRYERFAFRKTWNKFRTFCQLEVLEVKCRCTGASYKRVVGLGIPWSSFQHCSVWRNV